MLYVLVSLRSLIALVFVVSVVSKLRSRRAYAEFVAATGRLALRPVAAKAPRALAAGVVTIELAVVALLLVPATTPIGFGLAAALLVAFTAAMGAALRRGQRPPCRCFGASDQPLGYTQVVRNLILLVVAAFGVASVLSADGSPELAGALLAVAAGAVAATLLVVANDIAALFRHT